MMPHMLCLDNTMKIYLQNASIFKKELLISTSIVHYSLFIVSNHTSGCAAFFPHLCRIIHTYSFEMMFSELGTLTFFPTFRLTSLESAYPSEEIRTTISPHIYIRSTCMAYQSIGAFIVHLLIL